MIEVGFKDEFDVFVYNVGFKEFISDKCGQYVVFTVFFVRRFKFLVGCDISVLFDFYDKSYIMDLENFNRICKISVWGSFNDFFKFSVRDFFFWYNCRRN